MRLEYSTSSGLNSTPSALAQAQPAELPEPRPYQDGKDVVWVPTPDTLVEKMLDMAKVTPRDYVIDLGSGDGRNVIAAARRGARALGVEYDPGLVALARRNAAAAGVAKRARFVRGEEVTITAGGKQYRGKMNGSKLDLS